MTPPPAPWDAPAGDTGLTWAELRTAWLSGQTPNTARAYRVGLAAFFASLPPGTVPGDVRAVDVLAWRDQLRATEKKPATVRARLAAVKAFFGFLTEPHGAAGQPGRADNPAARVKPPKVEMYGRSRPTSEQALRRMLAIADPRTRAWLITHVLTGRRRAELARLTLGDLQQRGTTWWYRYRGKGRSEGKWRELPAAAVESILAWRGSLHGDHGEPLWRTSEGTLVRCLKRVARLAGLEAREIHVHGLRHLAAVLRRQDGDDIGDIQAFLDHRSAGTTALYLQALEVKRDSRADSIARRLLDGD